MYVQTTWVIHIVVAFMAENMCGVMRQNVWFKYV